MSESAQENKKIITSDDLTQAARIVHEVNRHYNRLLMDREDPSWEELDQENKDNRIRLMSQTIPDLKNISAKKMHDMWMDEQKRDGWSYGEKYDAKKKNHPCIVSWADLPDLEKAKDAMYLAVVKAMVELHFGIDKVMTDKIKEVKVPGQDDKVLVNKSAGDNDSKDQYGRIKSIDDAFKTQIERDVATMVATSHEYKKPNVDAALAFTKNYTWEKMDFPVNRLQGINKPIKQEKVDEIAASIKKNSGKVDWPFVAVNKFHGLKPQSHGKRILIDGHHRLEAAKAEGVETVPVYMGTYTGGSELDADELRKVAGGYGEAYNALLKLAKEDRGMAEKVAIKMLSTLA